MEDLLSLRVRASPESTALIEADTGRRWEYATLDAAAEETAGRLVDLGIEPGDHLGVLMPNDVRFVWLIHAAMRLGAVLVPLNARQTPAELAGRIDRADLTAVVCSADTEDAAVEAAGDVPVVSVDSASHESVDAFENATAASFEPPDWQLGDPLLLMFTSGTTGTPKAVRVSLGNVLWSALSSALRLGVLPDDRWMVTLALYHMGGIAPIYRSALYGTAVVLRDEFDAGPAADDIVEYEVTGVSLVPTMLRRMLDARGTLSDSLRAVLLGGAPAPIELLERCRNYSVPVYPTYGMTEAASQITTARPAESFANLGTVGRPLLWTTVTVRDGDGTPVPAGELGEIVVSGPTIADGYYDDPEATAEAYAPEGLYTGDVGYIDEAGRLWVLNRRDDRIITGGENVDPGEVVDVLRRHVGVRDAAVVGIPDDEWGEQVSALVVRSSEELTVDEVETYCREHLAGYKIPRTVAFADELPRTASGTVEREAVRERLVTLREQTRGDECTGADESGIDVAAFTNEASRRDRTGVDAASPGQTTELDAPDSVGDDADAPPRDGAVAADDGDDFGEETEDGDDADDSDRTDDGDDAEDGDGVDDGDDTEDGDGVDGGEDADDGDGVEADDGTGDGDGVDRGGDPNRGDDGPDDGVSDEGDGPDDGVADEGGEPNDGEGVEDRGADARGGDTEPAAGGVRDDGAAFGEEVTTEGERGERAAEREEGEANDADESEAVDPMMADLDPSVRDEFTRGESRFGSVLDELDDAARAIVLEELSGDAGGGEARDDRGEASRVDDEDPGVDGGETGVDGGNTGVDDEDPGVDGVDTGVDGGDVDR